MKAQISFFSSAWMQETVRTAKILSGIAKYYPNEQELVGKKVQIVANLKPRKMMGRISQGIDSLSRARRPTDSPDCGRESTKWKFDWVENSTES